LLDGISLVSTSEPGTIAVFATALLMDFMVVRNRRQTPARALSN
jgi:hypothetical protein